MGEYAIRTAPAPARIGAALLFLFLSFTPAAGEVLPPNDAEIRQFLAIGSLLCTEAPAADCIKHGWHFADANRDGYLDLEELAALRSGFLKWAEGAGRELPARERLSLMLAGTLVSRLPLSSLLAAYDKNGDGRLSQQELLADIKVDERPMAAILADRSAIGWDRIHARFAQLPALSQLLELLQ